MTRTPFPAHFVSNFLNMQVHLWPLRDLDKALILGVQKTDLASGLLSSGTPGDKEKIE
jgi:hypothetical protein